MRRTFLAFLFCLFFVSFSHAAPGAIRCGKLLDVRAGHMLSDQVVVFDDSGSVTTVGPAASTKLPAGVTAIDLSAATCLARIDRCAHAHHRRSQRQRLSSAGLYSVPREAVTGVKNARLTLQGPDSPRCAT